MLKSIEEKSYKDIMQQELFSHVKEMNSSYPHE